MASSSAEAALKSAQESVYIKSVEMPEGSVTVEGYDFNQGVDYDKLVHSFARSGFQALHFGQAVEEVKRMLDCRRQPLTGVSDYVDEEFKPRSNCTVFLGYTSNMASCGVRDTIRFLVEHRMVDVIVSTGGGIEEDFIKCMAPTYVGDFKLRGEWLRKQGLNRIGNLLVPNANYCKFEDWLMPILDQMLMEQKTQDTNWTPSKMIHRMGREINDPKSIYYWAYKNNIPVFSPAITDGAIGDNIHFHSFRQPGLRIDIVEDIRKINTIAMNAKNSGQIIVGGGLIKHHICNANLMRNGADFSVYINTANEFDGSDSGASPEEAVSWGKIKQTARPVKIVGEASIMFPLLVAETFAKEYHKYKGQQGDGTMGKSNELSTGGGTGDNSHASETMAVSGDVLNKKIKTGD